MKKTTTRLFALLLCVCMVMGMATTAFAADVANATIDHTKTGSLTIYKYDLTAATNDGVWDGSYVSTGTLDDTVTDTLGGTNRPGDSDAVVDLGNGSTSNSYAIAGVEFTYLKVADIVQYSTTDGHGQNQVMLLYSFDDTANELLTAIGLEEDDDPSWAPDEDLSPDNRYFPSQILTDTLAAALEADATTVKNNLENYIVDNGGTAMELTDADGMTTKAELPLGLYLVVETKVPEMVTVTVNPFFVSLPMTSVDGGNATDGGERWIYDVTVYPKNETGIPTLEKSLREAVADTGKTENFGHTATASAGDVIDYKIVSKLPGITSEATYISEYSFVDTLSKGLTYNKNDVVIEFFSDEACTNSIAKWTEDSGKFSVAYTADGEASVMTVALTETGLAEVNASNTVYTAEDAVQSGYSNAYAKITYAATVDSDLTSVLGEEGNDNAIVLTWKRTSTEYYDTLVDDAHVYTFSIDLTKRFSDAKGDFANVKFIVKNATDNYWVKAEQDESGVYVVTDHVAAEADATAFVPVDGTGKIVIRGLEDDTYILTETQTDNGYTLLDSDITVVITAVESTTDCDIYTTDVLGLIQNDPRFADLTEDDLANLPQTALQHYLLTASATIDGNDVTMLSDGTSANAFAPLTVTNTPGFDLPQTGEIGAILMPIAGIFVFVAAALFLVASTKRKNENN